MFTYSVYEQPCVLFISWSQYRKPQLTMQRSRTGWIESSFTHVKGSPDLVFISIFTIPYFPEITIFTLVYGSSESPFRGKGDSPQWELGLKSNTHHNIIHYEVVFFGGEWCLQGLTPLLSHPQFLFHKRILGISFYGIEEIDPSGRWVLNQTPTN